jgi:hypothetical protein
MSSYSNSKFNLLAQEIGKQQMIRLCRAFLIENRNTLSLTQEITPEEALDPMNCALHSKMMTGSLCYSLSENGEYPDGAPPCNGCSIGISEAAKEGICAAEEEHGQKEEEEGQEGQEEQEKQEGIEARNFLPVCAHLLPEALKDESFLPVGAHLLPAEFKEVLRHMHMDIQEKVGYWFNRANSNAYKRLYPDSSRLYKKTIREMSAKYPEALARCKSFQAECLEDGSATQINGVTPYYMMRNHCVLPYQCECQACSCEQQPACENTLTSEETSSFASPTPNLHLSYFN